MTGAEPWAGSGYTAPEGGVTPGQAAYEAWVATVFGYRHTPEWHKLEARDHAGWEAAAAAIAAQDARPAPDDSRRKLAQRTGGKELKSVPEPYTEAADQ